MFAQVEKIVDFEPLETQAFRRVHQPKLILIGTLVLAEIQSGVHVHAVVDEFDEDGKTVYLIGDDGEPYCTLVDNCSRI